MKKMELFLYQYLRFNLLSSKVLESKYFLIIIILIFIFIINMN